MTLRTLHQPYQPYAYAKSSQIAHVVLLVELGAALDVQVHYGDRYEEGMPNVCTARRTGSDDTYDYFEADLLIATHRLKYAFEVITRGETYWYGERAQSLVKEDAGLFQLPYLCERDVFRVPDWVSHAVCYQIFPERYANGRPELTPPGAVPWDSKPTPASMFGGDLPGITEHLDYIRSLGVNLIYMTPIFKAGSNHKYDTEDYLTIDPQFGTADDLRALVSEAHARGIRIVLDAVFNHCGSKFAPFRDACDKGTDSSYWNWFFIDGDHVDNVAVNYETFATKLSYMPKLNVANPAVEAYLLKVAKYWIQEFDIDGWRLDVANEVDHVFWRKFRIAVHEAKPDALIIGEVWHNSLPWLRGDQFDGVMNYLFRDNCLAFFINHTMSGEKFAYETVRLLKSYPEQATRAMFNLLGSHDTTRILTLAGGDMQSVLMAFVFQFTFPGIPMVYYGDEIGMQGDNDPDCRRGMVWDESRQNHEMLNNIRQLARLRASEPAFGGAGLKVVYASEDAIEYKRFIEDSQEWIQVAINRGNHGYGCEASGEGEILFATGNQAVSGRRLAPHSAVVWKVRDTAHDEVD